MFPWRKIKEDVAEGIRVLREEILAIFNKSLVGAERTQMRWALHQVEASLQQKYQEVGEKVCRRFVRGESLLKEGDVEDSFKEIERLQTERRRIFEEINDREE